MGYQDNPEGVRYQEDVYLHDHRHDHRHELLIFFLSTFVSTLAAYITYKTESTNEYFISTKRGGEKGGGRERQRTEVVLCRQRSNQATSAKILTGRKD